MKRGQYSESMIAQSGKADPANPGVELGRLCILHGYSVAEVTEVFGVTRTTVYNWFAGKTRPTALARPKLAALVNKLQRKPPPVLSDENE